MNLSENIRMALSGLKSNKMRSILTMLGIIIGIASVISILTVGKSMSDSVTKSFSDLGGSNIYFFVNQKNPDDQILTTSYNEPKTEDLISDEMIDTLESRFSDRIAPIGIMEGGGSGQAKDGRLYANFNFQGVNAAAESMNNIKMIAGRFITTRDVTGSRNVVVISDKAVNNMFAKDPQKALGQELNLYHGNDVTTCTVVGVYRFEENPMMSAPQQGPERDISTSMYIPITTMKFITGKDPGYQSITVTVKSGVDIPTLENDLKDFVNNTYYANNPGFEVISQSMKSISDQMEEVTGMVSIALSVIAGISLLVGGIGVMNIMLVSVTERTREIGVRKALGATNNAIRSQFIVESIIVCLIGGVIGILLGGSMGFLGSKALGQGTLPGLSSIAVAVSFSLSIGIFFGYYPANKAAKLDPIDALRYE